MNFLHKPLSLRVMAALLLAALVLPIASCSEEPAAPETPDTTAPAESTTAPAETEPEPEVEITRENYPDTLPELDLQNSTVNIYVNTDALYSVDWVAEQTGDLIQDAVYSRNLAVEERLNVKLNPQMIHSSSPAKSQPLLTAIMAGDSEIQIINIAAQSTTMFMQSGVLYNLPDLKYLDFDMPWWNQDVMDICTYNGRAFFATGEIAFRYLDGMSVVLFNTKLAADNNIGDLYQLFFDGKWTYDKMYEYAETAKRDLNGDGSMTLDDMWGLATNGYACMDPWYAAWDHAITKMDTDGFPELCVSDEKMVSMVEKLYIGIREGSVLRAAPDYAVTTPIVYYGSSIVHGGCATRPGCNYESIIGRTLDCDFINLGFAGCAKGEDEIANYIAGLTMSAFVYDYDHNAPTVEYYRETHERMFKTVRAAQPDLPIIMMSRPKYHLNAEERERVNVMLQTYANAIAAGDRNVYCICGTELLSEDIREMALVDNCHPTDGGFASIAKVLGGRLWEILAL